MDSVVCSNCHRPYPASGTPYCCPKCSGVFDFPDLFHYDPRRVDLDLPGIWRYRHVFGLPPSFPIVTLGEGNTPLVWGEIQGKNVAFKLENLNPTGSFKDRGSAVLVSFLKGEGVEEAVEDSSGNAGASLAAYLARAGLRGRIFIPSSASGPKRSQIEAYGVEVVLVPGPRSNAAEAVKKAVSKGGVYASHAYTPFNLPGYATLAFEVVEQMGCAPGTVILPAGQGGLLLGIGRGFQALLAADVIFQMPRLIGVQAHACAPLWALATYGGAGLGGVSEGKTIAEGIQVRNPLRAEAVLRMVESSQGRFFAVDEEGILPARHHLARKGFYIEPTSAVVIPGFTQLERDTPEPILVILTGSGFKFSDT